MLGLMETGRNESICPGVWRVGGEALTGGDDCLVYLLDLGEPVLIDCGSGRHTQRLLDNITSAGVDPQRLHTLLLTHAHVDHIGAAARLRRLSGCRVVAHSADRAAIESADPVYTVAPLYGIELEPCPVDLAVDGDRLLEFTAGRLELLHIPGHTAGSLAALFRSEAGTVLFGQDLHGPFSTAFASDLAAWRSSLERLAALEADILCEGHFGVFRPAGRVRQFIEQQLAEPKVLLS